MKITPQLAAIAAASLVAVIVAFVLRPAQLVPHPAPELSVSHEALRAHVPPTQALVYVAGAVAHPGVYAISSDARAKDALEKAGGATRDADLVAVNLAAHVSDGDEIAVPRVGETRTRPLARAEHRRSASGATRRTRRHPRQVAANVDNTPERSQSVDLNTADATALAELPGIGPTLAARIVEFRTLNGPFASVDGLADVAGITPQRLDTLAPRLTTGR